MKYHCWCTKNRRVQPSSRAPWMDSEASSLACLPVPVPAADLPVRGASLPACLPACPRCADWSRAVGRSAAATDRGSGAGWPAGFSVRDWGSTPIESSPPCVRAWVGGWVRRQTSDMFGLGRLQNVQVEAERWAGRTTFHKMGC